MPSSWAGLPVTPYQTARNAIEYAEFGNPTECWANDGTYLVRRLGCLISDQEQFRLDMLGEDTYTSGLTRFNRYLPQEDNIEEGFYCDALNNPTYIGQMRKATDGQYTTFVDVSQRDSQGQPTDGYVVYDATFRPTLYDVRPDEDIEDSLITEKGRFTILSGQDTVEALPMPQGFLYFLPYGTPGHPPSQVGSQYSLLFPQETIVIRWIRIPPAGFPHNTISSMLGKVNSVGFATPGLTGKYYDPETLLMMAPNRRLYIGNNGQIYIDIDIIMQARPEHGWNKFPTESGKFVGTFRRYPQDQGAYLKDDFNKIFDPSNG